MPPYVELRPGDPASLGGFDIRGRLGEGGQGVVYLGADQGGGLVAIKWLRPHLAGDAVAAERFAREAKVAQRVAPFCTAKVLATGVHEDRPYIVSEYVDGPPLQHVVSQEGPRAESAMYRLAIGTVTALAAIHQAGIVHRDFSPNNVLLAPEGPRVIDFGIAKALDVTSTITSSPVGTPAFMAPEQVLGQPAGVPADMFAWASTMVFAASGTGPFAAESLPAVIHRVLYTEPDLSSLSGPLRELVSACLSKEPSRRPTAEQVILRLLQHPSSNPPDLKQAAEMATGMHPRPPYQAQGAQPNSGPHPGAQPWGQASGAPQPESGPHPGAQPPRQQPGPQGAQHQRPGSPPHADSWSQPEPHGGARPYPPQPWGQPEAAPGAQPYGGPPWTAPAGHGHGAPPPRIPYPAATQATRTKRGYLVAGVAAALAVVVTVAVAGVVFLSDLVLPASPPASRTPSAAASPTPTTSPVPTGNLATETLPDTGGATLYEHPSDPIKLTSYSIWDTKQKVWVYYARDSLSGNFRKYPNHWEAMLSPDGRYLAKRGKNFTTDGYDSVDITDKSTGESFSVKTSREPLSAYIQAWSRDSRKLLVNVGNPTGDGWQSTGFAVVDVVAKKATVSSLREGALRDVRYGFDRTGTEVVALSWDGKQQALRFFSTTGDRLRRVPNVGAGIAEFLFSPSGERFLTNCPGLGRGAHCVYDTASGAEVRRFESACSGGTTWYDENHLACWVKPDDNDPRQQIQVIDFTGTMVRLLADIPANGDDIQVYLTFTRP